MDPSNVNGVLVLIPKPGNIDKVVAEASNFAKVVEEKEPGVLMFTVARSKHIDDPDAPEEVIVALTFKDTAAKDAHLAADHRVKFVEEAIKADLCVGKPVVKSMNIVGGFAPRH